MIAQRSLIAWNLLDDDQSLGELANILPRVIVVEKTDPHPAGWSFGYKSTNGACFADWLCADHDTAILNVFLLFRHLALEGIPTVEIDRAFMDIDEYKCIVGQIIPLNIEDINQ